MAKQQVEKSQRRSRQVCYYGTSEKVGEQATLFLSCAYVTDSWSGCLRILDGVWEMAPWAQALSRREAADKRNWHLAIHFPLSSLTTFLWRQKAPIFVILEEDAVEGMHIFFSRFCFRMFFILVIKLWVRQRWEWGIKQNTECSQIVSLSFPVSQQFYLSYWISKKE